MTLSRAFGLGESGLILQGIGLGGDSLEFPSGAAPAPPVGVPGNASEYFLDEISALGNPGVNTGTRLDTFWRQDGLKVWSIFIDGSPSHAQRQFDVSPAWGIDSGDWTLDFTSAAGSSNNRSIWWSPDGTVFSRCIRVPATSQNITTFDQSATPWDFTVLGSVIGSKSWTPTGGSTPGDHIWSDDGLRLWVQSGLGARIDEFAVGSAFDPSTITNAQIKSFTPIGGSTLGFSNDGTQLYLMLGQVLNSYDMSIPFDIDTLTNLTAGPDVPAFRVSIPRGLTFRNDNADIFVAGDQGSSRRLGRFAKSTGHNLDDFAFFAEKDVSGMDVDLDSFESIWVGPDGENLYTVRGSISVDDLFWFEMSPGHDISTLSFTEKNNADGQSPRAVALQEDGSTLFIYYRNPTNPDAVFRWPLSTDWDVDTKGSRTSLAADFSNAPRGLWFKPDGTELFLMDDADTVVYQFNLPTPWDFTGATQTNTFNYSGQSGSSSDLTFSTDGTKMYLCNAADQEIIQYNLTVPFDVSSAQFSGQFLSLPGGSGVTPRGVAIRDNFLYVCYGDNEVIEQFKVV